MAPWRPALGRFAMVPPSSQNARYSLAKRLLVGGVEGTELSNHERLLDGREHGFDNGRFEKPRSTSDVAIMRTCEVMAITTTSSLAVL